MKYYKTYRTLIFLLPILTIITACSEEKTKSAVQKSDPKQPVAVALVNPVMDQPFYSLELPGELKAYEEVILYPKVKGFVKKILVDRGSKVTTGQLLALLEAPEISQQYLAAKSDEHKFYEDYLYSRQSYERLKKAASKAGAVAEIELDRAKSKLRSDSAAFAAVKAKSAAAAQLQQYLKIVAPFDGIVTNKNVSVGALLGEGSQTALLSIAQTSKLRLIVAIPEKHAQAINQNTKISFTVKNHPGETFQSSLSRKSGVLNQASRAVMAEFDVQNQSGILGGGEYAQVKLNMRRPAATFWLPASSIVKAQSGIFIIKMDRGITLNVPVETGIRKGDLQEVFAELAPADQIVKVGTEELTAGTKIIGK